MVVMDFLHLVDAVKREAKGDATIEEIAWFQDPANGPLWIQALTAALHDAELQFQQQNERLARARADAEAGLLPADLYREMSDRHDLWLKKASRYRLGLAQRQAEVRAQRSDRAAVLEGAVLRHQAERLAGVDSADENLWKILDRSC